MAPEATCGPAGLHKRPSYDWLGCQPPGERRVFVLPRWFALLVLAAAASFLSACGNPGEDAGASDARPVRLRVFAAQSLAGSFAAIARAYEGEQAALGRPDVRVEVSTAASSALATQLEQGAPADVFASADLPQMERLARQGLLAAPATVFARNALVVAVPADNRARVESALDLARPGLKLVLYAPDVPIGHYARTALENLGRDRGEPSYATRVLANLVSLEANPSAALAKIELGEADATFVYRTDATTARGVRVIEIPASANVVAEYPIAVLAASRERALAEAFVGFVHGAEGQRLLREAGFQEAPVLGARP